MQRFTLSPPPRPMNRTPVYIVCSPRPRVGKTLVARLLTEYLDLENRYTTAFDINLNEPSLLDYLPKLTETASIERWFEPFFDFIHQHTDVVRGVSYINSDWDTQRQWAPPYANGYFGDSRVQASEAVKARWLRELSDPVWVAGN